MAEDQGVGTDEPPGRWRSALLVGGTVLALGGALPLLDGYLGAQPDTRRPGGRVHLHLEGPPARGGAADAISMVATTGWRSRAVSAPATLSLVSAGSGFDVRLTPVRSSAECDRAGTEAVLDFESLHGLAPVGRADQIMTADGVVTAVTGFSSALVEGLVFVACANGLAMVGTASAPSGARDNGLGDVDDMVATVRFR